MFLRKISGMRFMNDIQKYAVGFLSVMVVCYSVVCIFTGTRGLPRYFFLQQELRTAHEIDGNYIEQRQKLENKVKKFSAQSLDLDLLEERARLVLNFVENDEFVIIDSD